MAKLISPAGLVAKGITIGNRQRKNLEDKALFPKRVPITERTHGYVDEEIDAHIEAKIAARDSESSNGGGGIAA